MDRFPEVLAYAAAKFVEHGISTIETVEADVSIYLPTDPVDAVVGRLVLSYLPDPVATARHLAVALAPGGVYIALEYDTEAVRSAPPTPTSTRLAELLNAAFDAVGTPQTLGPHLGSLLRESGLEDADSLGLQGYLTPDDPAGPAMLVGAMMSLIPAIASHGLADPATLDPISMREQLTIALLESHAAVIPPTLVAAWGHHAQKTGRGRTAHDSAWRVRRDRCAREASPERMGSRSDPVRDPALGRSASRSFYEVAPGSV